MAGSLSRGSVLIMCIITVLGLMLTFSIAVLVVMERPCSISGAVKAHASSVIVQFLNASVPFADKSSDVGLMMLQMLL